MGLAGTGGLSGTGGAEIFLAAGGAGGFDDGGLPPDASDTGEALTSTVRAAGLALVASALRRAMMASASAPLFHFPPALSSSSGDMSTALGFGGLFGGSVGLSSALSDPIVVDRDSWPLISDMVNLFPPAVPISSIAKGGLLGGCFSNTGGEPADEVVFTGGQRPRIEPEPALSGADLRYWFERSAALPERGDLGDLADGDFLEAMLLICWLSSSAVTAMDLLEPLSAGEPDLSGVDGIGNGLLAGFVSGVDGNARLETTRAIFFSGLAGG